MSASKLDCVEVRGHLAFVPAQKTRMNVGTLMVPEGGYLEIGRPGQPIAAAVAAELVITDQAIDRRADPAQLGTGIIALGRVTMHGAVKAPTFVRLKGEAKAGQTVLVLEQAVDGWRAGDHVVIPDTRHLRAHERGGSYASQTENVRIASIAGAQLTLAEPLQYKHRGARDADGRLELSPHVGNLSRNVIVRSENPKGTRGHTMFLSRADVDLRFVEFEELGRTTMSAIDSTQSDF